MIFTIVASQPSLSLSMNNYCCLVVCLFEVNVSYIVNEQIFIKTQCVEINNRHCTSRLQGISVKNKENLLILGANYAFYVITFAFSITEIISRPDG